MRCIYRGMRIRVPRSLKSQVVASIILEKGLTEHFYVWRLLHPKIKSNYRAGNLFLIHRRLRYCTDISTLYPCDMDNLREYFLREFVGV